MKACILLLFALLAGVHLATAAPPVPADFGYGCALPATSGAGVFRASLPLAVYEKTLRADLGDMRVFNAAGEMVPHAVRRVAEEPKETRTSVPLFLLPGTLGPLTGDLSLRVIRSAAGAVVTVDAADNSSQEPLPASYLLDLSGLAAPPTELELQWDGPSGLFAVSLTHSSDLAHWSALVDKAVLADLSANGGAVTARRIALPRTPLPYVRLDCIDCPKPLQLRAATALSGTAPSADQWQWLRLPADQTSDQAGQRTIEYRMPAKAPITAVQLGFPAANSLVRALVESRPTSADSWRPVTRADFYRLDLDDKPLVNPMAHCAPNHDPLWRISMNADAAAGQPPMLELGWRPEELIFLGRGAGPYILAFGNGAMAELQNEQSGQKKMVLAALRDTRAESLIQRIEPGPVQTLAGEQALKPRLSAASWKKMALWAALIGAVALLAVMTRTMYREMQARQS